jgi:hypothetical protein
VNDNKKSLSLGLWYYVNTLQTELEKLDLMLNARLVSAPQRFTQSIILSLNLVSLDLL